ncbi:MAG: tRNA 2-thiouridine(34) synthase MnmA [Ruminococcaceae bacterium]|nr:tRNA 2-thiouridine(34) synthase MnmA [Oscillospiraceae bacterium]
MEKKKVVIGMSGGVDSSVAAALLLDDGYDVIGLTMRLWDGEEVNGECQESACCSASAVEDAKYVCYKLGIEHFVMDFRREFEENVIDYFVYEYKNGRTPNPCIACNKSLKFDAMLKKAELLGADYVATGHYAKVELDENSGRYLLKRAAACAKDQTYALYSLSQEQLSKTLMPLGRLENKDETRQIAEERGLITAKKPDSMEICFVPDKDYASFIERRTGDGDIPGNFVDINGNVLGEHRGIVHYTVGQRKGLGVTFGKPMFVLRIDAEKNEVVLGEKGTEFSDTLVADRLNFITFDKLTEPIRVAAKVRYSAKEAEATVEPLENGKAKVTFDTPQRAVTPGQAVVFYEIGGDKVIGGGIIE